MKTDKNDPDEIEPEYDFSEGIRGEFAERFAKGCKVVVLDPDVAELFADSASVNAALRSLAEIARRQSKKATG